MSDEKPQPAEPQPPQPPQAEPRLPVDMYRRASGQFLGKKPPKDR